MPSDYHTSSIVNSAKLEADKVKLFIIEQSKSGKLKTGDVIKKSNLRLKYGWSWNKAALIFAQLEVLGFQVSAFQVVVPEFSEASAQD